MMERFFGTLVTDLSTGRPLLRTLNIRVVSGPDEGASVDLETGSLIVGGHPEVDLPLSDARVSRRHLEIALVGDGVRLRDLDSKNGTRLEGSTSRIESVVVAPGTRILVGESVIVVDAADQPVNIESRARFGEISSSSPKMREVLSLLARVSQSDATVLLSGETGTGKDLVARTVHDESPRKGAPMMVFDCGAIQPSLIAGELFGHKKGAFTGAHTDRAGIFEAARGGTVFLDEIGELPLDLQPSLLRVLESRQVRRMGENHARPVDVRVIAATHRDLGQMVREGKFREDLYYRLAIVRLGLLPLRERSEDIPQLVRAFLEAEGKSTKDLAAGEVERLMRHDWPGNVRELRNTVTRACALHAGERLHFGELTTSFVSAHRPAEVQLLRSPERNRATSESPLDPALLQMPLKEARAEMTARFERAYAQHVLDEADGNVTRAAARAEVARNYLHRLLKRYGIRGRRSRSA